MKGPTTKRDFRAKRKSGEVFSFGGSGVIPQKRFEFLSSLDLNFCNFSMILAKTLQWGGGGGEGDIGAGGGGFGSSSIYVKKGPVMRLKLG